MTTPAPPHISLIQYAQQPDGSMTLKGLPHVTLETIEQQGSVTGRDWQGELGLPTYYEEWEAMAALRSNESRRGLRFVLMDESPTRLAGNPRLQPQRVTLSTTCQLELGHTGFVIGIVHRFVLGFDELRSQIPTMFGIEIPADLEGDFIIGTALLFDSPLAEKAWEGLQRGIFTHVCPALLRPTSEPPGTGQLVQVSLVPGDYPGCPNARVIGGWSA